MISQNTALFQFHIDIGYRIPAETAVKRGLDHALFNGGYVFSRYRAAQESRADGADAMNPVIIGRKNQNETRQDIH